MLLAINKKHKNFDFNFDTLLFEGIVFSIGILVLTFGFYYVNHIKPNRRKSKPENGVK